MKQTKKQRAERLAIWMAKATANFYTPKIRKEALAMFNKINPEIYKKRCRIRYPHKCSKCNKNSIILESIWERLTDWIKNIWKN